MTVPTIPHEAEDAPPVPAVGAPRRPAPAGSARLVERLLVPLLVAIAGYALLAPTFAWRPFQDSMENIVVATALETRRDGRWLFPTMQGEVRTRKPPLAVWLSAASVRPATVDAMSSRNPWAREAAYERFTRQVRWPALLSSCLMLVAVYDLGRTIGRGWRFGVTAAGIAGTNWLFLKHATMASFDTQLALWVTVCNACLARAALRGQWWGGCVGGGLALGLALMSKGPVAIPQTVLPILLFAAWRRWMPGGAPVAEWRGFPVVLANGAPTSDVREDGSAPSPVGPSPLTSRRRWLAALVGLTLALVVGLWWYALMVRNVPGVWGTWFNEVTRIDPADPRPERWYTALDLLAKFLPWTPWLLVGLAVGAAEFLQRGREGPVLAMCLLLVPAVIQGFFPERQERYLQPLVGAAAVASAWALYVSMPAAAATFLQAGRRPWALVALALVGMSVGHTVFRFRQRDSNADASEMRPLAEAVWDEFPDARIYGEGPAGKLVPLDMSIYTNRIVQRPPPEGLPPLPVDRTPLVWMHFQRAGDPEPALPSSRWQWLGTARRGKNRWHAYVLPPRKEPTE